MLKFLGTGSAFNSELGNNSAFVKKEDSMILIDCGGTVFHRIRELKLLEAVKNVYVIITHMHPDHIGSLGEVIFYNHYVLKNKVNLIYPDKKQICEFLKSMGVDKKMYQLASGGKAEFQDRQFGKFNIEHLHVPHVDSIETYGFMMCLEGQTIYYSGDASEIDSRILKKMKKGELSSLYQDTCGLDYEENPHLSFEKLKKLIDEEHRDKVYCMHLDEQLDKEEVIKEGFNITEIYK